MPEYASGTSNAAVLDPPAASGVPAWDYAVVSIHARHNDGLEDELKKYGREGWELVAVHTAIFNGTTAKEVGWLYFKRPIKAS